MSRIKSKDTRPEIILRSLIHCAGYRFRIHSTRLPGKPDIVFQTRKKVIFMHGCFWHRHKGCKYSSTPKSNVEFWQEKFQKNQTRDLKVQKELKILGWEFLIIWECEIKKLDNLLIKVINFLD